MRNLLSAVLFCLAAQCASAAPVNLVQQGDFENLVATPGDVPAWNYSGGDGDFGAGPDVSGSPTGRPGFVFYDGVGSNIGYLSQLIATVSGASYRLEFDLQRHGGSGLAASNLAQVQFGGLTVFNQINITGDWTHYAVNGLMGGAGGSTLLRFANMNAVDFNQLDNITLVIVDAPVPVPEPATPLVFAAAVGALLMTRRWRQCAWLPLKMRANQVFDASIQISPVLRETKTHPCNLSNIQGS